MVLKLPFNFHVYFSHLYMYVYMYVLLQTYRNIEMCHYLSTYLQIKS